MSLSTTFKVIFKVKNESKRAREKNSDELLKITLSKASSSRSHIVPELVFLAPLEVI